MADLIGYATAAMLIATLAIDAKQANKIKKLKSENSRLTDIIIDDDYSTFHSWGKKTRVVEMYGWLVKEPVDFEVCICNKCGALNRTVIRGFSTAEKQGIPLHYVSAKACHD